MIRHLIQLLGAVLTIFSAAFLLAKALMLCFDRYILKRYLGIETPLYKAWWRRRSEYFQRRLNKLNNQPTTI